jgi:hypothetical protein
MGFDIDFNPFLNNDELNTTTPRFPDEGTIPIPINLDMRSLVYEAPAKALDHITCPICKLPFIQPWSTVCGHTFCKECIFESFKSVLGERCPLDRVKLRICKEVRARGQIWNDGNSEELDEEEEEEEESAGDGEQIREIDGFNFHSEKDDDGSDGVESDDIYPAPIILSNITDDLMVYCLNKDRGCEWIGERWSVRNHLLEKCEYTAVRCVCGEMCQRRVLLQNNMLERTISGEFIISDPAKKIEISVKAGDADATDDTDDDADAYGGNFSDDEAEEISNVDEEPKCPHSEISCMECHKPVQIMNLNNHLEHECLENMTKCTGCHLSIPLMHIEKHRAHCQEIYSDCPGMRYGCTWKGQREILESVHKEDCPFIKLSGYLNGMEEKIESVSAANVSLKLQMSSILDSVVQGKVQNLGYPLELEEITTASDTAVSRPLSSDTAHFNDEPGIRFNPSKARMLVRELEVHKSITKALVEENIGIKEQMNNQRAMILSLQQQMQFMMIERRRMFSSSNLSSTQSRKSDTKLNTKL